MQHDHMTAEDSRSLEGKDEGMFTYHFNKLGVSQCADDALRCTSTHVPVNL